MRTSWDRVGRGHSACRVRACSAELVCACRTACRTACLPRPPSLTGLQVMEAALQFTVSHHQVRRRAGVTPHHILSHPTTSYHTPPHPITPHHILSHHTTQAGAGPAPPARHGTGTASLSALASVSRVVSSRPIRHPRARSPPRRRWRRGSRRCWRASRSCARSRAAPPHHGRRPCARRPWARGRARAARRAWTRQEAPPCGRRRPSAGGPARTTVRARQGRPAAAAPHCAARVLSPPPPWSYRLPPRPLTQEPGPPARPSALARLSRAHGRGRRGRGLGLGLGAAARARRGRRRGGPAAAVLRRAAARPRAQRRGAGPGVRGGAGAAVRWRVRRGGARGILQRGVGRDGRGRYLI
jgi:hypothetical protein